MPYGTQPQPTESNSDKTLQPSEQSRAHNELSFTPLGIAYAPNTPTKCAACPGHFDKLGDHSLTCCKTARFATNHNTIRDAIRQFLKISTEALVLQEVAVARNPPKRSGSPGSAVVADHVVFIGNQTIWLDNATVISTSAPAAVQPLRETAATPYTPSPMRSTSNTMAMPPPNKPASTPSSMSPEERFTRNGTSAT